MTVADIVGRYYEREALTLTLPMPETLTNSDRGRSRSWRAAHKSKKRYWRQLDELQNVGLIPPPPAQAFPRATLRSTMHLGAHMDDDNAVARHKIAVDWLRTRGYIRADSRRCLTWERFPEQIVKRDGNYRLVLTLTPTEGTDDG